MSRPSFPRTLPAFIEAFPDERSAFEYLTLARFAGGGFRCPKCSGRSEYRHEKRRLLENITGSSMWKRYMHERPLQFTPPGKGRPE